MNFDIHTHSSKHALSIYIDDNIIIHISSQGTYEISTYWQEDESVSFDNILLKLSNNVNNVITRINDLNHLVFPIGGKLNLLSDIIFDTITLSIYYPFTFTLSEFNNLKNIFKQYEEVGILKLHYDRMNETQFPKTIGDRKENHTAINWMSDHSINATSDQFSIMLRMRQGRKICS